MVLYVHYNVIFKVVFKLVRKCHRVAHEERRFARYDEICDFAHTASAYVGHRDE
jgi:hypothetical protein